MLNTFAAISVGAPLRHENLAVFPLFRAAPVEVEYILSDRAIESGAVTVKEVSESGSVPDLSVENKGDVRVLFLEGEELVGAKQNRVLNTSLLIAARSKTKVPVSCVERGRWGYKSRQFQSGGTHSPSKLRYCLKSSVTRSLKSRCGHRSDQGEVWEEVDRQQAALEASSGTAAMADTFDAYKDRVAEFQSKLQYVDGACGVAVAVGGKVVACDLFDKPATCRAVWERLLSGFILDAIETQSGRTSGQVDVAEVDALLNGLGNLPWQAVQPVGEGEESRAEAPSGAHASVLSLDTKLVHGSVVAMA